MPKRITIILHSALAALCLLSARCGRAAATDGSPDPRPFGAAHADLDSWATGDWCSRITSWPTTPSWAWP